ncbi:NAD(P)/FAD-dependent oxidoreductase [Aliiruegeria lutimaris]|uniref:Glycine/D-amino acid oxidase n=1 Tax=Aliiruegeria lutimaris TaxID=571298 RepID=A0A1G8IDP6_9RHOB|nr:FAD-binding oxidoreductase [Aliiruegeria lutimaris]SDI17026.1 Glycine/D-amino acid oxidase [Aliiruegeria lutimaris]
MTQISRITIDTPIRFFDPLPEAVDTVIIGGGVIGTFAALYLAEAGQKVLLCEKGRVAGEQSSRNWGWIRQQDRDVDELPVMMQALGLWHEANDRTGGACGVRTVGVNYLTTSPREMEYFEAWVEIARAHGLHSEMMTQGQIADSFNGHSDGRWLGGVRTPSDASGEPWTAVPAVAGLARESGALIRENCAVRRLERSAGRVSAVLTEAARVACEQVILAGGAWSSLFLRAHGLDIPQLSVRATVAQTAPLPCFTEANMVDEDLALRLRADGGYNLALGDRHGFYLGPDAFRHLRLYMPQIRRTFAHTDTRYKSPAGFPDSWRTPRNWSAEEKSPFERRRVLEPAPDDSYVALMLDRFAERFPEISTPLPLSVWAGMIDAMPDAVPIVDRAPGLEGLIVATGMSGHGFGIGPGYGRVLSRMVLGEAPEHDLSRFRFTRFTDGTPLRVGTSL